MSGSTTSPAHRPVRPGPLRLVGRAALRPVPAPRTVASDDLQTEVAVLTELLEVASDQLEEAEQSVRRAEEANTALTDRLQAAQAARDAELEDHLGTLGELQRARAEADALRVVLLRHGRFAEVAAAAEAPFCLPTSFAQLWERLDTFVHVRVMADRRIALALDEQSEARNWAAKAWSGLAALESYAEHRKDGFAGGFHQFCRNPPTGARVYPVSQVAMTETSATMAAYGHERIFPALDGAHAEMQSHLKLAPRGNVCPRVHFLDDVAGKGASGLVVVGYLGPHLRNKRTS
ncbi:hypothetical protein PV516_19285 [Streptomyces scabiei]|uniref:hypothetical protein n=1 Tax=Streptomyces scabiei TaxID=1930 RepID=UPI00299FBA10|nr:hypothetical protein [Streptomyces scabiei]MDX3165933.1 hypothetical protein [Streptomyces scabiei]